MVGVLLAFAVASSSALELMASINGTYYVRLDADDVQATNNTDGSVTDIFGLNLTSTDHSEPLVLGSIEASVTCKGSTYDNPRVRLAVLEASFINTTTNQTLTLKLLFMDSGLYSQNGSVLLCDESNTIALGSVGLYNASSGQKLYATVDHGTWNWTKGMSYSCQQSFFFHLVPDASHPDGSPSVDLNITNVQVQAFAATEAFAAVDNSADCPGPGRNLAGVIVGAVMVGLAVIGIVFFALQRCRGSGRSYEALPQ